MRRSPPAMPRNSPRAAATRSQIPGTGADRDADRALTALYSLHYRSLVKLAALLVADTAAAEEIAQDAFIEDVPAFVELESGGPPPGACRVVGHG